MTFEIKKCEGWGRLGLAFGKEGFITPNIVRPCFFNNNSFFQQTSLFNFSKCQENKISLTSKNDKLKDNVDFDYFPSCFIYPSLQMQGKSLEELSSFDDLFPVNITKRSHSKASYHLIPWDLPTIFLNRYDKYLQALNTLEIPELGEKTRLMLNVPFTPEILETELPPLGSSAISVVSLGDISSLLTHPPLLIRYLVHIKSWLSPNKMLYAPAVPSSFIPILVYLGIDLFDLLITDMYSTNPFQEFNLIFEQNTTRKFFLQVLHFTREAIETNKLRDLTRIFANSFPYLKVLLRISDKQIPLEKGTPLYGSRTLYCTDETDFTRPEVTRFRERVRTRYSPPSHTTGIIFLPCSAKKPYSRSKSHQIFRKVIRRNLKGKRFSVGEVILTSPLGVVPRNLEYSFPAAHYDIPVTGEWSQIEKNHLKKDLVSFLDKVKSSIPLVGYVKGIEREILKKVCNQLNRLIYLLPQDVTSLSSKESLEEFSAILQEVSLKISYKPKIPNRLVFLRTIADFQFGKGIGSVLIPDHVKIYGRKELGIRVQLNNRHHLTFRPETGYLTLSLTAGKLLLNHSNNLVTFDGQKIIGSTIFSKAIIKADPEIRPNDEVLIIDRNGELLAVGVAHLPGNLLVEMKRGKGVTIRQKVK
ncbi:MAG: DUF5591 domain-containing protein [Promethearchaeota archaeon]